MGKSIVITLAILPPMTAPKSTEGEVSEAAIVGAPALSTIGHDPIKSNLNFPSVSTLRWVMFILIAQTGGDMQSPWGIYLCYSDMACIQ